MRIETIDRGRLRKLNDSRHEREMAKVERLIWFFLGATSGAIIMLTVIYFAAWVAGVKI
jgi:hypothetical protein